MDRKEAQERLDLIVDDFDPEEIHSVSGALVDIESICRELIAQLPEPATGDRQEVIAALEQREREHGGDALLRSAIAMLRQGAVPIPDAVLSPAQISALKAHHTTKIDDQDKWYERLGWLICALVVLAAPTPGKEKGK